MGPAYLCAIVTEDQIPVDCIWRKEETLSFCIVCFFGISTRGLNVFL